MSILKVKHGRERSIIRHHPWVFTSAIEEVIGQPGMGDTVDIVSSLGNWLARAAYSPKSKIRARIWTWDQEEQIDADFFQRRIKHAIDDRKRLFTGNRISAYREVHAESDGIPGLIIDRYNEYRVVQFLCAGVERWRKEIVDALVQIGGCDGIYERSDVDVRALEGLPKQTGLLWGKQPEESLIIQENDLSFLVDIYRGHKTGFYLDQRENRKMIYEMAINGNVLNCFCYTGSFTVAALKAGATSVLSIDSSKPSLEIARENILLNKLPPERCKWIDGDVFHELRRLRDEGQLFDVIILDPPRFAPTIAQAHRAARGYKDINLLAFKLLRHGGLLFTFSCSGGIGLDLFQKIVADAAIDAAVEAKILQTLGQPGDHPIGLPCPESRYLKGLVCRKR